MTYVAIIDKSKHEELIVHANSCQMDLKPVVKPLLVLENGEFIYLSDKHINWLRQCEREEEKQRIIDEHSEYFEKLKGENKFQ